MTIQKTLHTLFEAQVKKRPDTLAIVCTGLSLTYGELNAKANQLAHYLRNHGVKKEVVVALCMTRSLDCLITILAILKAGGAYVPLDVSQPEERLLFILNDNNQPILITQAALQEKFINYQGRVLTLEQEANEISQQATHNPDPLVTSKHLAYIIYTSGSTGTPKGVLIEHGSVVNYCLWLASYCRCKPAQRIDFSSNYIFDMAVTTSIAPLTLGLTIIICSDEIKKGVRPYLNYLAHNKVNIIKMTPSYFKVVLLEVKRRFIKLPHLQTIILGGENLSTTDCSSWLFSYPKHTLFNEYGPTEATVAVSQYKVCKKNISSLGVNVPIGNPGTTMNYYIFDADNTIVPKGEHGELYIGGICLARGYLNQPKLTKKYFIKNPFSNNENDRLYKTGDLCRELPDNTLEYLGRMDDQVKIRGFRVEPGEIEKYLSRHPAINGAVVLAREEALNEKRLIAYYILEDALHAPSVSQLRHYLQLQLPDYMIPTAFVRVDAFPLTANGKLNASELPIPQFTSNQYFLAPSSELEKTLAELWSEELGVKPIGLKDDFFELGGHSLSAARIISKLNHSLGKNINLHDFYESPTIEELVSLINKKDDNEETWSIQNQSPYTDSTQLPLSDFQLILWLSNTFEPKAKKLNITARKRLQGRLNVAALQFAFKAVFKKHEILLYRILKFSPMQSLQKSLPFKLSETSLQNLSERDCESALEESIKQLINCYPWPQDASMIIARLFYLKNDTLELQICMPHIISDNVSPEILFAELSRFYLLYNDQSIITQLASEKQYRSYIINEQNYLHAHLDRDIIFWGEYLKNAHLLTIPSEQVVKDMKLQGVAYSTYLKVPENVLTNLQGFCARNHLSAHDGLCATLLLALLNCCGNHNEQSQPVFINIVKSTRDNPCYDEALGCFLRLEPIKVTINKQSSLTSLSREIHEAAMNTNLHQQCSDLVKLASLGMFCQEKKIIKTYLMSLLTFLYTSFVSAPKINRKILNLCWQLSSFERNNNFIININMQSNFLADEKIKNRSLFGLETQKIPIRHYDLLTIDAFLDVCFIRDENPSIPYIVISANLKPAFRERIAKEMIRIIESETMDLLLV